MKKGKNRQRTAIALSIILTLSAAGMYPAEMVYAADTNLPQEATTESQETDKNDSSQADSTDSEGKQTDESASSAEKQESDSTDAIDEMKDSSPAMKNSLQIKDVKNAGDFDVTGGTAGTDWEYNAADNLLTFHNGGDYTVTGGAVVTTERILVGSGFIGTITIEDVNIDVSTLNNNSSYCALDVNNTAKLTLQLSGENSLKSGWNRAGLEFSDAADGQLTITSVSGIGSSDGLLEAQGGDNIACIGGGNSGDGNNITISGGTVRALGSRTGAGIGGGDNGSGKNIIISGGIVEANSKFGAGIGGGDHCTGDNSILISGGRVTVTKAENSNGAAIGGGNYGSGSNHITISGGTVEATGDAGAGIGGGGYGSENNNVVISGGDVTASSPYNAIGGGFGNKGNNSVTISGGTITAASAYGDGISGGFYAAGSCDITIDGGSVKSSMSVRPKDSNGNEVYLLKLDEMSGVNSVSVDGTAYKRSGDHPADGAFYLYLAGEHHTVSAGGDPDTYYAKWNGTASFRIIYRNSYTLRIPATSVLSNSGNVPGYVTLSGVDLIVPDLNKTVKVTLSDTTDIDDSGNLTLKNNTNQAVAALTQINLNDGSNVTALKKGTQILSASEGGTDNAVLEFASPHSPDGGDIPAGGYTGRLTFTAAVE